MSTLRAWAPILLLAALGGALVGDVAWVGAVQGRAREAPPGWEVEQKQAAYQLSELAGQIELDSARWALEFSRGVRPVAKEDRSGPEALGATVLLGPDGRIELWPSHPDRPGAGAGVALVVERSATPRSRVIRSVDGRRTEVACSADLPAPTDAPLALHIQPAGQGVEVQVGGVKATCDVAIENHGPLVRPGLRRVGLSDLSVAGKVAPAPGPGLRPLWALGGALVAALIAAVELFFGTRRAWVVLTTAPLMLALPLHGVDAALFLETARATWLPASLFGAGLAGGLSLLAKVTVQMGRLLREPVDAAGPDWPATASLAAALPTLLAIATVPGPMGLGWGAAMGAGAGLGAALIVPRILRLLGARRPQRVATVCLAAGTAAAVLMSRTQPFHPVATLFAGGIGLAYGALVWANMNAAATRAYNLTCLGLVGAMALCSELMVRYTEAGLVWSGAGSRTQVHDIYGWVPNANEEFALFEKGEHTAYPDRGFPVAPSEDRGRVRVVAMGGSTTGGAFQNDNLDQFYPAEMERLLYDRFEVLNQGVGGWTTWHIRRYLADHFERVAPDILTLYVGHNDLLTPVPMPYAQLHAAWQRQGGARSASSLFGGARLYQGLRYTLIAMRPSSQRVAVPLVDAEENLRAIIAQATGAGARVILASEGLDPDPGPLQGYNALMARLAEESPAVEYVDVANHLHQLDAEPLFLDDCHLTAAGHREVAALLAQAVSALEVP